MSLFYKFIAIKIKLSFLLSRFIILVLVYVILFCPLDVLVNKRNSSDRMRSCRNMCLRDSPYIHVKGQYCIVPFMFPYVYSSVCFRMLVQSSVYISVCL